MRKDSAKGVLFFLTAFLALPAFAAEQDKNGDGLREVHDFIKGCGHYFLATVEGDQPRVRPFGTVAIFEGRLYLQTGRKKDVSRQMAIQPKIELCAYDGKGNWVRVQAVAVNDDRREAKQFMLDAYPELKGMYSADDDNTQVLYLKDVKARFHSFGGEPRLLEF
ncbi:MAG: pyridoxamine 5'-phosphate oxidase family protein [Desulfovibrio sp.]|jgi:uncharacterized pyridoxamine 5'-phosphate oxidase family protein|nr:pyridoxamine 5'-phosphate oxidase family protein [Desulfovibrio sp.]